ncbi:MFS general substrate transporter [Artomyces pyxidatus]|uniref:MFS general substrate transporter n=1 Tax=Artomyces pyxidatus TaxID=48021 RepID=A0ACB8STM9_9AGAM|nr:MFS general substrate transporter [Artomyces pyxidatus]
MSVSFNKCACCIQQVVSSQSQPTQLYDTSSWETYGRKNRSMCSSFKQCNHPTDAGPCSYFLHKRCDMASYFLHKHVPHYKANHEGRPILQVLFSLTWVQWALFLSGWLAWTCYAMDFFSVSLSVTPLQVQLNEPEASNITTATTLSLLPRPIGAVIFGVLSDRYGRKWPLVLNLMLCAAFELGSGFVRTFCQFLAIRSLFGIAMGGVWGRATSTAHENLPVEVRGLASGVLQEGYSVGYLFAAVLNLRLVPETSTTWAAAGMSLFATCIRAVLPESAIFLRAKAAEHSRGTTAAAKTKRFWIEIRAHWASSPSNLRNILPLAFRSTFSGIAYQLAAMVASASSQIEAKGGDHLKTTLIVNGKPTIVPNYATVQGIFIGAVAAFTIFIVIIGPECVYGPPDFRSVCLTGVHRNHGSQFEKHKAAFEEDSETDEVERKSTGSRGRGEMDEKERNVNIVR